MDHDFGLFIDGEQQETEPDLERVQLEREDVGEAEIVCANCGFALEEVSSSTFDQVTVVTTDPSRPDGRAWVHSDSKAVYCNADDPMMDVEEAELEGDRASPIHRPFSWANSAAISLDDSDESITVTISVGDPRGAFTFTVRRIPDDASSDLAGRLIMHTPYPGEPIPHEKLTEIRPGTYLIG